MHSNILASTGIGQGPRNYRVCSDRIIFRCHLVPPSHIVEQSNLKVYHSSSFSTSNEEQSQLFIESGRTSKLLLSFNSLLIRSGNLLYSDKIAKSHFVQE